MTITMSIWLVGERRTRPSSFDRCTIAQTRGKHGHGPRMPAFSSFIKTLVVWLVLSLGALFFWLRYAEMLPASVLEALPETYSTTYHVLAIACSILSGVILIYELLTLTKNGQIFLDSTFQLLKAVYIGFLMIVVSMLYIPISRQASLYSSARSKSVCRANGIYKADRSLHYGATSRNSHLRTSMPSTLLEAQTARIMQATTRFDNASSRVLPAVFLPRRAACQLGRLVMPRGPHY